MDLLGAVRVTVFSPDDLTMIKGGPALRRTYLDQLLVQLDPRYDAVRSEFDKARVAQARCSSRRGVAWTRRPR